jgi:hypothetical protein
MDPIHIITTQTNYTAEEAASKLDLFGGNPMHVIRDYMGLPVANPATASSKGNSQVNSQVNSQGNSQVNNMNQNKPNTTAIDGADASIKLEQVSNTQRYKVLRQFWDTHQAEFQRKNEISIEATQSLVAQELSHTNLGEPLDVD